ncbi:MAG: hypothetical protein BGP12_02795 [Rhodospirillales bacterium 70-18]|nr:hypothetical protein [Rhodospirillales bacterium]OJY77472.1 MAG: hypothetical protein BGP12_02795 [Rhodospirillales bacterium 70-18]
MPDAVAFTPPPDLTLLLAPDDTAHPVGPCDWTNRLGRREAGHVYVVVHRRHGLWTHVYRVVADARPGRLLAYLERAMPGDCVAEARAWAQARFMT